MQKLKKIARQVHLWLGLVSGLLVMVVCLSGCLYAFQYEIKQQFFSYYTIPSDEQEVDKLSLQDLLLAYKKQSNNDVLRIYDFVAPQKSTILKTSKDGEFYYSFLHPYTGALLQEHAYKHDFFHLVMSLHRNFLLGKKYRWTVGVVVLVFMFSLITGLVLWWPKRWKILKTSKGRLAHFGIKQNVRLQRRIYDLHNVLGFYASFLLFIMAITGLNWTFKWMENLLYVAVTFEQKIPLAKPTIDSTTFDLSSLDLAKKQMDYTQTNRGMFIYKLPTTSTVPLQVSAYPDLDSYGSSDHYYIHPRTAELLDKHLDKDKTRGTKYRAMYYDIHTGSVFGILGKVVVFTSSLIGASLPLTGFLIWWRKRKKNAYL
ncbi:MAG: PepSY-associated TM helix domain-containing protein, partial [Bacteroidota bacterium]